MTKSLSLNESVYPKMNTVVFLKQFTRHNSDDDDDDDVCFTILQGCTNNWSMTLLRCSKRVRTLRPCGLRKTRRRSGKTSTRGCIQNQFPSLVTGKITEPEPLIRCNVIVLHVIVMFF